MISDKQVGDKGKPKKKLFGVRAILGVRSRVFQEMLYGISTVFGSPQVMSSTIGKQKTSGRFIRLLFTSCMILVCCFKLWLDLV